MIVDERIVTFINSLDTKNSEILETVEREALATSVPIIRREMQSFLKTLLLIKKPMRILEVGTAVGFSALLMSEYAPEGCRITTIENYEKRIPIARENFRRAGKEEQIALIEGDAAEVMKKLEGPFDFIFMDAAKGQYIHYLPEALRLLPEGGVLVSDNVMQDGEVIESRFAVERRNRTIHARMREYLYELKHNDALVTSIIPLGDGVAVSVKQVPEAGRGARQSKRSAPAECGAAAEKRKGQEAENGKTSCLYRRRGVRTAGKGEEFFHGRDEGRDRVCT